MPKIKRRYDHFWGPKVAATPLGHGFAARLGESVGGPPYVLIMRLLHTSDWHLGRSLHRADLGAAQAKFLDHLVDVVRTERVDAVLVAGDVYDRAVPPLESIRLFEDALLRMRDAGAAVVVTSGNHDSPQRLGVNSDLLNRSGVHLRTRVRDVGTPVLLSNPAGEVAVYALPYLEPDAVRAELGPGVGRTHADVVTAALHRTADDLARRDPARTILMAHGWVHGGEASDSERDISVGGVGAVPAALFHGFAHTALGHLHGPQQINDRLRYSGSALAYSFSEASHRKGAWLIDLDAPAARQVTFVATPEHRRLSVLTGDLEHLLAAPEFTAYENDFVAITLTDTARPLAAMERLRTRFAGVLNLGWTPPATSAEGAGYGERLRGRSDLEIATDFVAHARGTAASDAEFDVLADAFAAARQGPEGEAA
jgi:exonuclease SbcD